MSRTDPLHKRHVLYLGDISEPFPWLPSNIHTTVMPILDTARVGAFTVENPSTEEIRSLERTAQQSNGIVTIFKAGGTEFCVYIGSREQVCEIQPGAAEEGALGCRDFVAAVNRHKENQFTLTLRDGSLTLGERTKVMGILNVTP
ncbi:MAG: hypothetical protein HY801_05740, partial [Candidatus Lindowbacteria bacterium]|nr:hypothetical protein [Candidatus Lindowbacteria bacterium]